MVREFNRFVSNELFNPRNEVVISAQQAVILLAKQMNYVVLEALIPIEKNEEGSSNSQSDQVASFLIPSEGPIFSAEYIPFCLTGGVYENLTGGLPIGGFYLGPGVMDNGDGLTFNFAPALAGEGVHQVTYFSLNTDCASAFQVSEDLIVVSDVQPPEIECLPDVSLNLSFADEYFMDDFTGRIIVNDNCQGEIERTQFPLVGTPTNAGTTQVTITVKDGAGNEASCSFRLNLSFPENSDEVQDFLTIYPNPGSNEITLFNSTEKKITTVKIRDLRGRLISEVRINNSELENQILIESLSSGMYFISVNVSSKTEVMRLLKR